MKTFLYPPNGLCVLPVLMRNRLEVQIRLTVNAVCVPAHTQMHVPVCVYMLQGVRKRNRSSVTWGMETYFKDTWNVKKYRELFAAALGFKSLQWGSQLFRLRRQLQWLLCVWTLNRSSFLSNMPITHGHPALVSTIVLAKVTPFPPSPDFQNSLPSAFCCFSLRTESPGVLYVLQVLVSLA